MRMAYLVLGNACYIVLGILCNADAILVLVTKRDVIIAFITTRVDVILAIYSLAL